MPDTLSPQEVLTYAALKLQQGDPAGADNLAAMILEKNPHISAAWLLRAQVAILGGGNAEPLLQRAQACADLGSAALDQIRALQQQKQQGQRADALLEQGNRHYQQGQTEQARYCYAQALQLAPRHAHAWTNMGLLLHGAGLLAQAQAAYEQALQCNDQLAVVHNNYGILLQQLGQMRRAEAHYQRALSLQRDYGVGWKNYASLLQDQGRFNEAGAAYAQAHALLPSDPEPLAGLAFMDLYRVDWPSLAHHSQALMLSLQARPSARIAPFMALALQDDPAFQLDITRRWAAGYTRTRLPAITAQPKSRIRLGYLGGDFHSHATSWLTAGLFARHDRSRFEVIGYDYGPDDQSPLRARVAAGFDRFEQVATLDDPTLAQRIRDDGIDILIDLKGWTRRTRTQVLAYRPAPLQLHYLGYPGTLGADWIDYQIVDAIVAPPDRPNAFHEALIRLPHCYQINDCERPISAVPSRAQAGLPDTGFVFACFNQHYKLSPAMWDAWMRLLQAVPHSVLWLLDPHPEWRTRLQQAAEAAGVSHQRLVFAPALPQADHLARLSCANLMLDTLPCNAHTTASDALWAGVPVLTCMGQSMAARVAASCLHAVGLSELITSSLDEYLSLALKLATHPQQLSELRARLLANRLTAPLFDTAASVRALEQAYQTAWNHFQSGQQPQSFDIASPNPQPG
ncbi:glycosyltransferase family 41 protein [Chitinimonas sp. BJYL2]|uniref:O-linked N-acetylglucosamine transferase, SPINDLY family protein n=1 Tax=Chitinimonas sp. BJYL2 TaxID=2976696 RepID=UPI0022B2DFA5|nr:glycosyltransferase family 41 protein [Chitinimonas sp. BJYL2]